MDCKGSGVESWILEGTMYLLADRGVKSDLEAGNGGDSLLGLLGQEYSAWR